MDLVGRRVHETGAGLVRGRFRSAAYGWSMEGKPFGRYRLVELLGRGGMGEVWRAYDSAANNRVVAIKLLPAHLAGNDSFVQRFRREADTAAQLSNKHVIPIHNYGEIDGQLYVDMRLIEGRDLQAVLAGGRLRVERGVRIIEQVAKALQAAHKAGLVHRDVKPSNILLDEDDDAYLIDFGLAVGAEQTSLTQSGTMIGSWHYMAPERFRGSEVDHRADIYALACVLYECLTGNRPFPGDTLESQAAAHLADPPPRPSIAQPDINPAFDEVVAKGMAKDANARYSSAKELAAAARAALGQPTTPLGTYAAPTAPARAAENVAVPSRWSQKGKRVIWAAGITATVVVLCLVLFLRNTAIPRDESKRPMPSGGRSNLTMAPHTGSPRTSASAVPGASHDVVVSFTQVGRFLEVRFRNPNTDVGLVRSPFELAILDENGALLGTEGQGGLPGAMANTIYQLPPGGEYGLAGIIVPEGKTVGSVQLTILGKWLQWDTVNPPQVALTDATVRADTGFSGPSATGRLTLDRDGPLNVIVVALVKTSAGTVVSDVVVDCVQTGQQRTFQTLAFAPARGPYELESAVAYVTSVPGTGPQYKPTC